MKKYIRANSIPNSVLDQAVKFAEDHKGGTVDLDNHIMTIPLSSGSVEDDLMSEGMLGRWYEDNGFTVSFSTGDVEYITQPKWTNYRGWNQQSGHKAYLRNRLIMTVTW